MRNLFIIMVAVCSLVKAAAICDCFPSIFCGSTTIRYQDSSLYIKGCSGQNVPYDTTIYYVDSMKQELEMGAAFLTYRYSISPGQRYGRRQFNPKGCKRVLPEKADTSALAPHSHSLRKLDFQPPLR